MDNTHDPVVTMCGVGHQFGEGDSSRRILFDVELVVEPGEMLILTGPSGSGKTTLLTLVGALRSLQEGTLTVLGRELFGRTKAELNEVRRNIGFVFQAHNLFDSLTAEQNVTMALELENPPIADRQRVARQMLERVGLGERIAYKPHALSGGQRQRVAIARALAHRPRLVLADEPTAALDKESGRMVIDLFRERAAEDGSAVLLVTHDARILDAAHRIVNMVDGRVVSDVRVARTVEICEFLARASVFAGQSPAQLAEAAEAMRLEKVAKGQIVFRAGDAGDRFYVIRQGRVSVSAPEATGARELTSLGPGDCFGEMALLEDQPRSATIRTLEDAEFYTLSKAAFHEAMTRSRSLRDQILELLSQRR
jgi:putative ABC transport system ATP-binding protein